MRSRRRSSAAGPSAASGSSVRVVDQAALDAMPKSSPPPPAAAPAPAFVACQSCGATVVWRKPGKLRVRVANRFLFVRLSDGVAEITCERCGEDVDLPLRLVDEAPLDR